MTCTNDYPVCPGKVKVSNNMLSGYCKKIAEKYKISIGLASKLIVYFVEEYGSLVQLPASI